MPLLLTNDDVAQLLTMAQCIDALEQAYRELGEGRAGYRPRSDLYSSTSHEGAVYRLRTMEGIFPSARVAAIRIGSDVVHWYRRDGRLLQGKVAAARGGYVGLILLFDTETTELLCVFPDGWLQHMRVGATSGLAAKYLARPDARVATVMGAGWQARGHIQALAAVRELERIYVYSPTARNRERLAGEMRDLLGMDILPADDAERVVAESDIVACATNSLDPVVRGDQLRPGMHVSSVEWCELDDAVYRVADVMVTHIRRGDVQNNIAGLSEEEIAGLDKHAMDDWQRQLPELSEILLDKRTGRRDDRQVTCFVNNVGCGLQFAAAGAVLYAAAKEKGVGRELPADGFIQSIPS